MTNEEHIKVFDRGFAEGRAFGVRDVVLQDEDRIALAMATLVAEAYLVANNEQHTCYTAGPLAGNEKTDWRCRVCDLVHLIAEQAVQSYLEVQANINAMSVDPDDGGPTE